MPQKYELLMKANFLKPSTKIEWNTQRLPANKMKCHYIKQNCMNYQIQKVQTLKKKRY